MQRHVCPPSETDARLLHLYKMLEALACDNIAPIPIAMSLENDEWVVDVHVRIKGVTEYEVTGTGKTLADALQRATYYLSREAAESQKPFNYEGREAGG